MRVGVLALQGGSAPHLQRLRAMGHEPVAIRGALDVRDVEGIVLPGGESTAQHRLMSRQPGLLDALRVRVREGAPVLATCAGLILAARRVRPEQPSLRWLDVTVRRNAWGRQLDSAEARADDGTELVLIRAPRIEATGDGVRVELTLDGEPVLVRQGRIWGATFHPELTASDAIHARVFGRAAQPSSSSSSSGSGSSGSIRDTARISWSQASRQRASEWAGAAPATLEQEP